VRTVEAENAVVSWSNHAMLQALRHCNRSTHLDTGTIGSLRDRYSSETNCIRSTVRLAGRPSKTLGPTAAHIATLVKLSRVVALCRLVTRCARARYGAFLTCTSASGNACLPEATSLAMADKLTTQQDVMTDSAGRRT